MISAMTGLTLADASKGGFWLPAQASDFAVKYDALFDFILWLSVFFFVLLMGLTAYFAIKYRKKSETQRTSPIKHNFRLEFLWSAVPTVLLVVIFAWGFTDYTALSATPSDALKIRVVGKQWNWTISYPELDRECTPDALPDGTSETTFYVPVNRPFTTQMSSDKVLHSFWIPAFRVKKDVLPNRYTSFSITPTMTGRFRVACAEYCGMDHSRMAGWVEVLSEEEWEQFTSKEDQRCKLDPNSPDYAPRLFLKYGCSGCHSVTPDMAVKTGPALYGLDSRQETLSDGTKVDVDDNYLRESIEYPERKIVAGYEGASAMPAFRGRLTEQELAALVDYIKGLDDEASGDGGGDAPTPDDGGKE